MHKTNAMRVLDARRIPYTAYEYDSGFHSGVEVAALLGAPPGQVFKTLVVLRERGRPILAIIPSDRELDLKRMAAAAGEKRVRMAHLSIVGSHMVNGVSALHSRLLTETISPVMYDE